MRRYVKSLVLATTLLLTGGLYHPPALGATLLPNGMQVFLDGDGKPVASGCVYFFVPGTTNPKDTWGDPDRATANTNPVQLNAAGQAVIYGVGSYRQIVTKPGTTTGNPCSPPGLQVWDQLTADTSSSVVIYAGASAGTPDSVTVNAPSFTGGDGQVINYISTNTNTAAVTINPSGFGAIQVMRDSATGPGPLTGGELVATNAVSVIYDAAAGVFHILSPINWPNTSGVPVGTVIDVAGFVAPTNYAFAYGQAVSRAAFPALFSSLTLAQTGSISSGSPDITGLSDTTQLGFGMPVESIGIPGGATLLRCSPTSCTMNTNATTTRSGTMTFFAYGSGDGSTTFNLPDFRGVSTVGRDNIGGTAANNTQVSTTLTTTLSSASATVGSATGLALGMFIQNPNVPAGTVINDISGTTVTMSANASSAGTNVASRFSAYQDAQVLGVRGGNQNLQILSNKQLPSYTPAGTVATSLSLSATVPNTVNGSGCSGCGIGGGGAFGQTASNPVSFTSATATSTFTGTNNGGLQMPIRSVPSSRVINKAVRLVP